MANHTVTRSSNFHNWGRNCAIMKMRATVAEDVLYEFYGHGKDLKNVMSSEEFDMFFDGFYYGLERDPSAVIVPVDTSTS